MKIDQDLCALLVSNFNPELHRLMVVGNMHILNTEFDVEEIFGVRASGPDV